MESVFRAVVSSYVPGVSEVSILGLMESVFRVFPLNSPFFAAFCFNPWFNGICIQGLYPGRPYFS